MKAGICGFFVFACMVLPGCGGDAPAPAPDAMAPAREIADSIFSGGDIVTVDSAQPQVEAVAVKDGRILALGTREAIEGQYRGDATRMFDLAGRTLLPGFIDGHSHVSHALGLVGWANVSIPPVGSVDSIAALIEVLRAHAAASGAAPGDWILAYGYDADGLTEQRHITRDDLDAAFPDNPVLLLHVSGHGLVLNSAGFERAGIDASTPTPEGGVIVRKPGSQEPAGLLMETAAMPVYRALPQPDAAQQLAALDAVQKEYARNGYTTIQDGATDARLVGMFKAAAQQGALWLDMVALPLVMNPADLETQLGNTFGSYSGHLKFGGIKVLSDGSPQGRTAYFSEPMLVEGPGGEQDWRGAPFISEPDYQQIFRAVHDAGVPVWTHANGDAAIDMVIRAHELVGASPADDRRDVVIHSQFVRPDQLDSYARLGIGASFFTNHAYYWGDVHLRNLGDQRAFFLSPLNSAQQRGIHFSNHSDFAVTPLDPAMILWTAVARESRTGVVIGPDERVTPLRALESLTIDAAWLYHEEDTKGSISPGKLADFVVMDANPLTVPVPALRELEVEATVKEGVVVYGEI